MKIALIGYGNMGKEIERAARERSIAVGAIIDPKTHPGALTAAGLRGIDVCIDFSAPETAVDNIRAVASAGKNMVVGTTGWYKRLPEVRRIVARKRIGFLYAPNFSIGMNIFLQLVASAAATADRFAIYDAAISETHHRGKADSPSGTALAIGEIILRAMKSKTSLLTNAPRGRISPKELHVTSTRLGSVPGIHRVTFDSDADGIELVHTAKSRAGFALGALLAARWLKGKKGFYTMNDMFASL